MKNDREQWGRIGVLMGGYSSEREISLKSGRAIYEALKAQECDVIPVDIKEEDEEKILNLILESKIDLAFIALHGQLGEDGRIQSILEKAHIPYTGSGVKASRLALNKIESQNIFKKNDINVPAYVTLSRNNSVDLDAIIDELGDFPLVVKPSHEGSSIGITIVTQKEQWPKALDLAWSYASDILVERYIQGREVTVGILDQTALPVVEICPHREFFDFTAKYEKGVTDYIVPAPMPHNQTVVLQDLALKSHRILGCSDFSRVDFILDENWVPYVLEVNTIPGFTATSLLPKAAAEAGIPFDELVFRLTELAYGKKKEGKKITASC